MGAFCLSETSCYRKLTESEEIILIDCERESLNEMRTEYEIYHNKTINVMDMIFRSKWSEFNKLVLSKMRFERNIPIDFYCNAFEIGLGSHLQNEYERIESYLSENTDEIKNILNRKITDNYKHSYVKKHDKAIKTLTDMEYEQYLLMSPFSKSKLEMQSTDEYVENGKFLVDRLVNVGRI